MNLEQPPDQYHVGPPPPATPVLTPDLHPLQNLYRGKRIYQDRVREDRQAVWRAGTITVSCVTYPHLRGLALSNTRAVLPGAGRGGAAGGGCAEDGRPL